MIAEALETGALTIYRTRRRFVEEGLEAALARKKQQTPSTLTIFDGEAEAKLLTLACPEPPAGHARRSLRLLEKRVVEPGIVETASDSTIHRVLKKRVQTAQNRYRVIPHRADTAFGRGRVDRCGSAPAKVMSGVPTDSTERSTRMPGRRVAY